MARDLPPGTYFFYWHDVSDDQRVPAGIRSAPARFRSEIAFIARHFEVLSLDDGIEQLRASLEPPARPRAVLCFDDGYRSVLTHATPVLAEAGLPYTVFLNPAFLDQAFVSETMYCAWLEHSGGADRARAAFGLDGRARGLWQGLKPGSGLAQLTTLRGLAGDEPTRQRWYLSWDELDDLPRDRVSFANHTTHHLWLANLSATDQRDEVRSADRRLSSLPGYRRWLALPFGSDDCYNADTLPLAAEYSQQVLIKANGSIRHRWRDGLLEVERIALSNSKPGIGRHISERLHGRPLHAKLVDRLRAVLHRVA